jgi:2-oxoglutarate dehydrogenase E2 component (dihydrolipoamide succinyltransferase)
MQAGEVKASKEKPTPSASKDAAKEISQKPAPQVPKKQNASTSNSSSSYTLNANQNTFFSPLVVSIAKQHHISFEELARIPATGNDGRLRKSDIFKYIEEGRPAQFAQPVPEASGFQIPNLKLDKGKGKIVEMDRMRQMIADHMVFSKHTSPHVTAYVEADLTDMVNWRNANKKAFQEKYGEKLTFTPLFVEAVAKAVKDFPMINVSVDGKNIIVKENINIGMATALPSGNLIVPVVKNADHKDLKTIAAEVNALAEKARNNKLKHDETSGSTFTISNVGTFGSLMGTPIINQPEVAILATGIIKKRAEVMEYEDGDKIEIRQMMYLSLSFDHRVVDGFLGGSFLRRVADYFEDFKADRKI